MSESKRTTVEDQDNVGARGESARVAFWRLAR